MKTIDFINKANEIHNNKYKYVIFEDKVLLKNKIRVICPIHGEFYVNAYEHLKGRNCSKCSYVARGNKQRLNTETFIEKARQIHGNKYEYSRVKYVDEHTKVCILCMKHGEFYQEPNSHLCGRGCPKCARENLVKKHSLTTYKFIENAHHIHGNKYDYSKVNYINGRTKVCIICPEHGEFWQTHNSHLRGQGCPKCSKRRHVSRQEFIKKAKLIHGDCHDYSDFIYKNTKTKGKIYCKKHNLYFEQTPQKHLSGQGCPKCRYEKSAKSNTHTLERFVADSKRIHGDKYDYSKVNYIKDNIKVEIVCHKKDENGLEHGSFWITPSNHKNKKLHEGCPKCARENTIKARRLTTEQFIKKAKDIHNDEYDYSKVNYINGKTKVCIICHKHGEFWQQADNHLLGQGCPKCNVSKLEKEIRNLFNENSIYFIEQKTFDWLKYKKNMYLDFYLPDYNIAIECQGIQHFEEDAFGGNMGVLNETQLRDNVKFELCKEHGIKLFYYVNYHYNFPYKVYENKRELLNKILK